MGALRGVSSRLPIASAALSLTLAAVPRPSRAEVPQERETRHSVSVGAVNRGALRDGVPLPNAGPGFVTPEPWRERGLRFGTEELLAAIQRAAVTVAHRLPGGTLAVADLSAEGGGRVARHHSHQSGRDVDLIYFAIDRDGAPFPPDAVMALYGDDGRATRADSPEATAHIQERFFDLPRNWALVEALATDPQTRVDRIFVSPRIRSWLLAYARASRVPEPVLARVASVLSGPGVGESHADHMHVRVSCSVDDIATGRCSDQPVFRRRHGRRLARSAHGRARGRVAERRRR